MTTDTSEKGLETLIMRHMTGTDGLSAATDVATGDVAETLASAGGTGYFAGRPKDYDRAHALDAPQLFAFLRVTQPDAVRKLGMGRFDESTDIIRLKFLTRLSSEIGKRGVIDVLRKGIDHHPAGHFDLFYGSPSAGNVKAALLHAQNRFSITRQLGYSMDETRRALDLCLFINGLPIATFELKNSLTKQTVDDAIHQYKRDRDPRERLFEFGRCVVHFAVDDSEVRMCTELKAKGSWFLPFNKGFNDGAGNPPNPHGLKPDYLWKEVLTPAGLANILENYAQIVEEKDSRTGKKQRRQVWPRYHQLGVVRKALDDVRAHGAGTRYLIQHSAGSGKSNSIAWLAHQLIGVKRNGKELFDSVIVVTDRRILDEQIQKTIKQFMQVGATVGAVTGDASSKTEQLRGFIAAGKKIIISTVLEAIDMDSYRVERKAVMKIAITDEDAQIEPVPADGGGRMPEPELDRLSNILKAFNEHFGTLFTDADRVAKRIREDIAPKVAADATYRNAKENTPHTARMAHDQALSKVMQLLLKDDTQVYKQFVENESFRRFVGDMVYSLTSEA